ncbi:2OG-Fe(II) oxygenase [Kitasatospora sp. RB6PN24]|uniref:2OG-Fe(II) oxygenase n=1 Tax=Kitasatospora humi TaxID=2893891 RepID=UPI001E63E355|nr:2OG-Fe(II) oxygenase [Kitasatospora humi]MCC9311931.1 2OG-Fe(II) oxygenase [Kitasatospora humi]
MTSTSWNTLGPLTVDNALPAVLCEELLRHFEHSAQRPRSYQGMVDQSMRNCEYGEVPEALANLVTAAVTPHVDAFFGVATYPVPGQPTLIYRYGPGVGFVTHHDEVTAQELERAATNGQPVIGGDLTTVLFLSGPYEYAGGALYFEEPPLDLRPAKGALVAFPATRAFMHGVRPITAGARYTVLARRFVKSSIPSAA